MSYVETPEAEIGFMTGFAGVCRIFLSVVLVAFFTINIAVAEGTLTARPVTKAFMLANEPILDGDVLGDPAWQGLTPATGFWQVQPDEGQAATQKTEVYIGVLEDALYIGMVAYDDD